MSIRKRRNLGNVDAQDAFEHRLLLEYLENLHRHAERLRIPKDRLTGALSLALDDSLPGLPQPLDITDVEDLDFLADLTPAQALARFRETRKQARLLVLESSGFEQHVNALAQFFGLDDDTAALFGLIARLRLSSRFSRVWDVSHREVAPTTSSRSLAWLAAVAGVPLSCAEAALLGDGLLVGIGLCSVDSDGDIEIVEPVKRLIRKHSRPPKDLTEALIGRAQAAELTWDEFSHLGESRDFVARLLGSASERGEENLHIVLHGPPGTGKTEFARTLAHRLGLPLIALGEEDEAGGEAIRQERLAAVRLAGSLLGRSRRKALLLVDEAEDVLDVSRSFDFMGLRMPKEAGSKIYLHRLLERFPVPVIWIVNDLGCVQDTVIRRMSYVLEMEKPNIEVRRRVWSRALAASDMTATPMELDRLAREFDTPPGIAASSVRAAALVGGGLPEVRGVAANLVRALKGEVPPSAEGMQEYVPELVNADRRALETLERLTQCTETVQRFSLCLYGPPGTGKSAYARHLAKRLGLAVVQKRASDLLSMWVGGSEQNIAAAFRDARRKDAMLIFDEADSLLRSREHSRAGWEVSQVNEMLTWMESHPLPFVCTTNLLDTLDPASLRRFTFKLRFDYLDREQARRAFAHFFGRAAPPDLGRIGLLTPADFALARKRALLGGFAQDDEMVLGLMRDESRIRPDHRRPMGFQAA